MLDLKGDARRRRGAWSLFRHGVVNWVRGHRGIRKRRARSEWAQWIESLEPRLLLSQVHLAYKIAEGTTLPPGVEITSDPLTQSITDITAPPGVSFPIELAIEQAQNPLGFFDVAFTAGPGNIFNLTGFQSNEFPSAVDGTLNTATNNNGVSAFDPADDVLAGVPLFTFTFQALAEGNGSFSLAQNNIFSPQPFGQQMVDTLAGVNVNVASPPPPPGDINGRFFADTNENGAYEDIEFTYEGVNVLLDGPSGPMTTTTDAQGLYSFFNLDPGNYTVSIQFDNFSSGSSTLDAAFNLPFDIPRVLPVVVASNETAEVLFPSHYLSDALEPNNTSEQATELDVQSQVVDDQTLELDDVDVFKFSLQENKRFAVHATWTLFDPAGNTLSATPDIMAMCNGAAMTYSNGVLACDSMVDLNNPLVLSILAPSYGQEFNYSLAITATELQDTGAISGRKIYDSNRNGSFDAATDLGVVGMAIELYDTKGTLDITDDTLVLSTTTGANGEYQFSGLPDGEYIVRENLALSGAVGASFEDLTVVELTVTITDGAAVAGNDLFNVLRTDEFDLFAPNDTPQTATALNNLHTPFASADFLTVGASGFDPVDYFTFVLPTGGAAANSTFFVEFNADIVDVNNDGMLSDQETGAQFTVVDQDDPNTTLAQDDGSDGSVGGVTVIGGGKTAQFKLEDAGPEGAAFLRQFVVEAKDEADDPAGPGNNERANATDINAANGTVRSITPARIGVFADVDWYAFVMPEAVGGVNILPYNNAPVVTNFFDGTGAPVDLPMTTNPVNGELQFTGFDLLTGTVFLEVKGQSDSDAFYYDINAQINGGSISGTLFEDLTGDGFSADDLPYPGFDLELYRDNGDGVFVPDLNDTFAGFATTDANGAYSFSALPNGTYFVFDPSSATVEQTAGGNGFPNEPYYTVVISDQMLESIDRDFANTRRGSVTGLVVDGGDNPLPGALVRITPAGGGQAVFDVTDENGRYSEAGLLPGSYRVTVEFEGFNTQNVDLFLKSAANEMLFHPMSLGTIAEEIIVSTEQPTWGGPFQGFGTVTPKTENGNDFVELEEHSDSGITADLALPGGVSDLLFRFRFPQAGVGDALQVNVIVDGVSQTIATFAATDFADNAFHFSGPISLRDFAGQDVTLELRLATVDPVESVLDLDSIVIKALPFDTVLANEKGVVEYTDADGNKVTVSLKGAGALQVLRPGGTGDDLTTPADALGYVVTGSDAKSSLSVKVKADRNVATSTGITRVTNVEIDGPIKDIKADDVDLLGDLTTGPVKSVKLHDVKGDHNITIDNTGAGAKDSVALSFNEVEDLVLTSLLPIKSLTAVSWTDTNDATVPDKVQAPSLGKLTIKGDKKTNNVGAFEADIVVTGDPNAKTAFGGASIVGPVDGVNILITGDAGSLAFKDAVSNALVTISGAFKGLSAGDLSAVTLDLPQGTSKITGKKATNVNMTGGDFGSLAFNTIEGGNFSVDSIKSLTAKADKKTGDVGAINNLIVDLAGSNNPKVKDTLGSLKADGGSTNLDVEMFGSGGSVDLKGAIDQLLYAASGDIKSIKLGDVNNAILDGDSVGAVQAVRWLTGQAIFTDLKSLKTTGDKKTNTPGDLGAAIGINPDGVSTAKVEFGGAKIAGNLTGVWNVFGSTGAIAADAIDAGFDAVIELDVKSLSSKAMFDGFIAARSFGKIDVKTTMTAATIIAFSIPGESSSIGSLKTGGDVTGGTRIYVGVDPVNDTLDDDDDVFKPGADNFIKSLTIGGDAAADTDIVAGAFPKTVKINKEKVDPNTDDRFTVS